ncbi:MAG TPA: DUF362 domain-containing protein [Anaerolineaceae bacterium]|nr:DUF362 domain-containing protein [Anaerolineaceae bacterium]
MSTDIDATAPWLYATTWHTVITTDQINNRNDLKKAERMNNLRFEVTKLKAKIFRLCPKTGRIVGLQPFDLNSPWLFPLAGLAALAWVLLRVVPKPSRARYPCQQVAIPLAASFVSWLLIPIASVLSIQKIRSWLLQRHYLRVACSLVLFFFLLGGFFGPAAAISQAAYVPHPVNTPIGVARGLAPGRVVWVHNPEVTDWVGPSSVELWYEHIDPASASAMMSWALLGYSEENTPSAAWDAIFRNYNSGTPYQAGEKIYIKINLTTVNAGGNYTDASYNPVFRGDVTQGSTANSPQLLLALLQQLVNVAGVAQTDITIGDATGLFVNYLYTPLHDVFPNVHYEDHRGTLGRSQAAYTSPCVEYGWSTTDADGKTQDCAMQSYEAAKYLINFSVLKSHERAGITVAAKNHYGSNLRTPTAAGYYDLHNRLPLDASGTLYQGMGYYRPLVDLMGNDHIGGKTLLYLVDAIYGGKGWASNPSTWNMAPFNGDWPSSLFLSMDPVATDSVAFDFLSQQWPEQVLAYEGVQDFLHEAAQANSPTSGTCYDPEKDGTCMTSLGVHEHWNNATSKQYSRNLGTGTGIELLYVNADPTSTNFNLAISVSPPASGATLPAVGTHSYPSGEIVSVTATPNTGYQFDHWEGACTGSGTCSITMNSAKSVTAFFVPQKLLGDVNNSGTVDSADALIVLSADVGLNTASSCPMNCGDVNADGLVNSTDALIILSSYAGMQTGFQIGQPGCPAIVTAPPGCLP